MPEKNEKRTRIKAALERIQKEYGLETIEEAAEWLVKTRLRINTRNFNGRGRALYLVKQETKI